MSVISVLSIAGAGRPWWSWHLAWMLAEQGLNVVWVEASGDEWSKKLLTPLLQDEWKAERLPTVQAVARGDAAVQPFELPDLPSSMRVLLGWPELRGGRLEADQLDARLAAWASALEAWVILHIGSPTLYSWTHVLQQSRAAIVLAAPNRGAVRELRILGKALDKELPPERRYAFIDPPNDRSDRDQGDYWRRRVPGAFRDGWLGRPDATETTPTHDVPWCVGTCLVRPQVGALIPTFRQSPEVAGHGVTDAGIIAARTEWHRIALGVAEAVGLALEPPAPLAERVEPTPEPHITRFVAPYVSVPQGDLKEGQGLEGFLPELERHDRAQRGLVPLAEALGATKCVVLLGEPGIGKSYELDALCQPNAGRKRRRLIALGRLLPTDLAYSLQRVVDQVVLDGADEWPGDVRNLLTTLEDWLDDRAEHLPELLIAGREGATMDQLATLLERHYTGASCQRFVLQPFRRGDAEVFVRKQGIASSAEFLSEIEALELAHLAARPVTLKLLTDQWRPPKPLPGNRVEVYQCGLQELLSYQIKKEGGDLEAVRQAAQRIAWVAVLRKQVRGRVGVGAEFDIDLNEVDSHFKGLKSSDYATASVSPIFEAGYFVHPTYAEYLAARHADESKVRLPVLMQWLFSERRILLEHLAGLASWLVAISPEVAERFVQSDPGRLLVQSAHVHPEARAAWLEALVEGQRRGQVTLWRHSLRELVDSRTENPRVLSRARQLVTEADTELLLAGVKLLVLLKDRETLAAVAGQPGMDVHARVGAIEGLADLGAVDALVALKPFLSDLSEDTDGAIRGALLEALWPVSLSAIEVIRHLPRPHGEADPNYAYFLDEHATALIEGLDQAGVIEALGWLGVRRWFERGQSLLRKWPFETPLLRRAWQLADDADVAQALGRLMAGWVDEKGHDRIDELDVDWYDASPARHVRVLQALLGALDPQRAGKNWWTSFAHSALVPPVDVLITQAEAAAAAAPELARRWLRLARVWRWTPEVMARVSRLSHLGPEWEEQVALRAQPSRPYDWPKREEEDPPLPRVERARHVIQQGKEHPGYWGELSMLLRHPDGVNLLHALTSEEQVSARELARTYFMEHPWEDATLDQDSRPVLHAWQWLHREYDLTEALDFWAPGILIWTRPGDDVLTVALRGRLGDRLPTIAGALWERHPEQAHMVVRWLEPWWGVEFEARARARLAAADGPRSRPDIGLDEALEDLLEALLELPPARETFWQWAKERLPAEWVARRLIQTDGRRFWREVRARFLTDDAFARELGPTIAGRRMTEPWWARVESADLADLYIRLQKLFPPIDRSSGRVYQPEFSDRVRQLGSSVCGLLVRRGAVEAVARIVELPGWHKSWLLDAERVHANADERWIRPEIKDIAALSPRLGSSRDLGNLVLDALHEVQRLLDGESSPYKLLFEDGQTRRKPELEACQFLKTLLDPRLGGRIDVLPPTIDLETQTHGGDSRVDFTIRAPADDGRRWLTVKIECKWADHDAVKTAMRDQLSGRYLTEDPDAVGIYLVLWWHKNIPVPGMPGDWRDGPEPLDALLKEQAHKLALPPRRHTIEPVVLRLQRSTPPES